MNAAIYFWRGCVVYVGPLSDLPSHSHLAAAICAGLDGPIEIRGRGLPEWSACRTALVPPGAVHEVRTKRGRFGTILTEPGAANELNPASRYSVVDEGEGILVDPAAGPRILAGLSALGASEDCGDTSSFCPERLLGELLGSTRPAYERSEVDARLIRVIEILLADPAAAPEVASLAAAIDMSSSWLQHNFRAQLGVPIRRFRTFFRLKAAALFMRRGSTLVDAALAAGFYDQPHFSNAFREMFGIQPGLIFLQDGEIRWYIDDELFVSDLVGRGLFHLA